MDFTKQLKAIAWTEAEVAVMLAGAVVSNQFIADEKIFKDKFASNPAWFTGSREGAPWYIKHSGIIKAGVALYGSSFIKNPWIKLALMGVAFQGTLQEARVLTHKADGTDMLKSIGAGNGAELDDELRRLADSYRMNGPMQDNPTFVKGPMQDNPTFVRGAFSYTDDNETYGF